MFAPRKPPGTDPWRWAQPLRIAIVRAHRRSKVRPDDAAAAAHAFVRSATILSRSGALGLDRRAVAYIHEIPNMVTETLTSEQRRFIADMAAVLAPLRMQPGAASLYAYLLICEKKLSSMV